MKDKILFVVTSHGELGDTGKKTGYFLSEVTHPWSDHVVVDGRLITGQNPMSALSLGKTLLNALRNRQ